MLCFIVLKRQKVCKMSDQHKRMSLSDTNNGDSFSLKSTNYRTTEHLSSVEKISEQVVKLTKTIEDLALQANQLDTVEDVMIDVQRRLEVLQTCIDRLKSKLSDPYNKIAHRIVLLNRLKTTCDMLRKIIRVIHLSKRLTQSHLFDGDVSTQAREIIKCSQHISELEVLFASDDNLANITIIQNDVEFVRLSKEKILVISDEMLTSGIEKQDITMVHNALQVYSNLKIIDSKLSSVVEEKVEQCRKVIKDAFDTRTSAPKSQGPGGVVMSITATQNASFRKVLWDKLEDIAQKLSVTFSEVHILYKTLKRKREVINDGNSLAQLASFFNDTVTLLSKEMRKAANDSNMYKETLEKEYPKMLRIFSEFWGKFNNVEDELNIEVLFRDSFCTFENAYVQSSVTRLFDAVNFILADTQCPSTDDIKSVVKNISNELAVASIDKSLHKAVAKNVSKAVQLLVVKFEQLHRVDGDSTQVIGPLTASQTVNALIAHRLYFFKKCLLETLTDGSHGELDHSAIKESLNGTDVLLKNTIEPLLASVQDAIEAIILTIQGENFSGPSVSEGQCSLYMRELQGFIARVQSDYFASLPYASAVVQKSVTDVASRTIDLFMRHTTLIRPLDNKGKLRLAADYAQLEMALGPFCQKLGDLGKPYRALRAFKTLLFQDEESISKSAAIGELIPYHIILQFIISGHGPVEMKLPHEYKNWSISRYTTWMDEHNELDKLYLFRDAINAYVSQVHQTQAKSFASTYPIVLKLLQDGLQKESSGSPFKKT